MDDKSKTDATKTSKLDAADANAIAREIAKIALDSDALANKDSKHMEDSTLSTMVDDSELIDSGMMHGLRQQKHVRDCLDKQEEILLDKQSKSSSVNVETFRRYSKVANSDDIPTADWIIGFKDEKGIVRKMEYERAPSKLLERLLNDIYQFWTSENRKPSDNRKATYEKFGLSEDDFETKDPVKIFTRIQTNYMYYLVQLRSLWYWMQDRKLILDGVYTSLASNRGRDATKRGSMRGGHNASKSRGGKSANASGASRGRRKKVTFDEKDASKDMSGRASADDTSVNENDNDNDNSDDEQQHFIKQNIKMTLQSTENESKFGQILKNIELSEIFLRSEYELYVLKDPTTKIRFEAKFSLCNLQFQDSSLKLTAVQQILMYLYSILRKNNFRRYNKEYVYKEEETGDKKIGTHYWVQHKTVDAFIREELGKDKNPAYWLQGITNEKNFRTIKNNLQDDTSIDFPDLITSRYHFRFDNGCFDVRECNFYPDEPEPVQNGGSASMFATLRSDVCCCNKFEQEFPWKEMLYTMSSAYHSDPNLNKNDPISYVKPEHAIDDEQDEMYQKNNFAEKYPIENAFKDFKFGGQYNIFLKYWKSIETPLFDSILQTQCLPPEVIAVVHEQMGKMMFNLRDCDNWDQMLFIKGIPGSGKSTLLNILRQLYKKADVGIMSPNMEEKFGLSNFFGRYILVCPEVKKKFGLTQTDFQMMAESEEMSLARKNKIVLEGKWLTPFMFAGNEVMDYIEFGSNVGRRMMVLEFTKRVKHQDLEFLKRIKKYELPKLILKWTASYLIKCVECGPDSIWKHVPSYFWETRKRLSGATNPMILFLEKADTIRCENSAETKESGDVNHDQFYIREKRFQELFHQFCSQYKIKSVPNWTKDNFQDTWDEYGIRASRTKRDNDRQKHEYFKGLMEISPEEKINNNGGTNNNNSSSGTSGTSGIGGAKSNTNDVRGFGASQINFAGLALDGKPKPSAAIATTAAAIAVPAP